MNADPALKIPLSKAETLAVISAAEVEGKSKGQWPGFQLKISRRASAGSSVAEHIAVFTDATAEQIFNVEAWLQVYAGGGTYQVHVYDPERNGWTFTTDQISGQPKKLNAALTRANGWAGPVLYVSETDIGVGQDGGTTGGSPHSGSQAIPQVLPDLFQESERRRREAEAAERRLEAQEARRREEATNARMMAIMEKMATPPAPVHAPAGPSLLEILSGVAAAVIPAVKLFLDSQNATAQRAETLRKEETEVSRAAQERAARSAEEQGKQYLALFEMQTKKAAADMELQSAMQRMMAQQFATMLELRVKEGGGDDPWWKELAGVAGVVLGNAQAQAEAKARGQGPLPIPQPQVTAAPVDIPESVAMDRVEDRIRRKEPNVEQVVAEFLNAVTSDEPTKLEMKALGGAEAMVAARMTDFFKDPANKDYAEKLMAEVAKQTKEKGITL